MHSRDVGRDSILRMLDKIPDRVDSSDRSINTLVPRVRLLTRAFAGKPGQSHPVSNLLSPVAICTISF